MSHMEFDGKADAYLEWAQHTKFAHAHTAATGSTHLTGLLLRDGKNVSTCVKPLKNDNTLDREAVKSAQRIELAVPITEFKPDKIEIQQLPGGQTPVLVIGVIDDGCPFARQAFIKGSRVKALWRQDAWSTSAPPAGKFWDGKALSDAFSNAGGDDVATYAHLGLTSLRRHATHGAHMLDVLAGPMPARSRVSPSRMKMEGLEGQDGSAHQAPTWAKANDAASQAPIVFVQLPKEAIEDPTGRWLGRHVLDGVDFILAAASKLKTPALALMVTPTDESATETQNGPSQRVVINISWGPQTGPHDGSSLLEIALQERKTTAQKDGQELLIVLPAGNSYEARAHAQFSARSGCGALFWHVMPDAASPQFLEIWWPANTAIKEARITITAPDGTSASNWTAKPLPSGGHHGVFGSNGSWHLVVVPHTGNRQMALVALAPTRTEPGRTGAPHGRWTVRVAANNNEANDNDLVHVYVARNNANMGGGRRAKDSYLFDEKYEATRHGRWPRQEPADSLVCREGTLSGLATGADSLVAGGYVLSKDKPEESAAPYTSSGPGAGTAGRHPNWALPSDESPYLQGIRGGGVREGTSIRLVGTSAAAPQLARKLANGTIKATPTSPPARGRRNPSHGSTPTPPAATPVPDPRLGSGR